MASRASTLGGFQLFVSAQCRTPRCVGFILAKFLSICLVFEQPFSWFEEEEEEEDEGRRTVKMPPERSALAHSP
jgi:hypothetical protein